RNLIDLLTDLRDFLDVALLLVTRRPRLGSGRVDVAVVDDRVTEQGQLFADARDAQGRGPHVDAPAAAAEVHADANDVDGLRVEGSHTDSAFVPQAFRLTAVACRQYPLVRTFPQGTP